MFRERTNCDEREISAWMGEEKVWVKLDKGKQSSVMCRQGLVNKFVGP